MISLNVFIGTISSLVHEDRKFRERKHVKKREQRTGRGREEDEEEDEESDEGGGQEGKNWRKRDEEEQRRDEDDSPRL